MAKTTTPEEIDLRDAHLYGNTTAAPFYDLKVRVSGSTRSGYAEMFGVFTGATFNKDEHGKVTQIIVYMEGQQHTAFDTSKSGVWISAVERS